MARTKIVHRLINWTEKHVSSILIFIQNILRWICHHHCLKLHLCLIVNNLIVTMTLTKLVYLGLTWTNIIHCIFELALMVWQIMYWLYARSLRSAYLWQPHAFRLCFLKHRLSLHLRVTIKWCIYSINAGLLILHSSMLILIWNI